MAASEQPSPRREAKWAVSTVRSVFVVRTALGFFLNGMGLTIQAPPSGTVAGRGSMESRSKVTLTPASRLNADHWASDCLSTTTVMSPSRWHP
eukprot:1049656-Rhodomonas_salina.1